MKKPWKIEWRELTARRWSWSCRSCYATEQERDKVLAMLQASMRYAEYRKVDPPAPPAE